jgi:Tol biopolymer transport system component
MRIVGLLVVVLAVGCSGTAESQRSADPAHVALAPPAKGMARLSGSIAYAAGNGTDIRIFEAAADGSHRRLLVDMDPGLDMAPQVSPDGRMVLFRHNPSPTTDRSDIWSLDRATGALRNLTR